MHRPGSTNRGHVQWLVRAMALTFALHGGSAHAQSDARAHDARRVDAPGKPTSDSGLADEIRFALVPLPEQLRDGATVMHRLDVMHDPVVVRQGTNGIVCMRFVPGQAAWDARCYDTAMFKAFMRSVELFRSALSQDSVSSRMEAEVRAGTLMLPAHPTAGYRVLGGPDEYNPATGAVTSRMEIWQSLHVPFATAKEMGLPDESTVTDAQRTQTPYVMASGTWWAHVMLEHPMPAASKR